MLVTISCSPFEAIPVLMFEHYKGKQKNYFRKEIDDFKKNLLYFKFLDQNL